ncbi:MAG: hypothetical protein ACYDEJ_03265 [Desulfitobacteriaceae bacterium]
MKLLSEMNHIGIAIPTQSLNGTATGAYHSLSKYGKALFVVSVGAMAAAATSILQVMQAKDALATSAKVITNNAATITANTAVTSATLTLATVTVGQAVTINGLTYTAAAAADLPNRVFSQAGDDTADATSLAAAINHSTAGVPGIKATAAAAVITLTATDPGEATITITAAAATITAATVSAVGYVECDASFLDINNGFTHVALRVTNSAAIVTGAIFERGEARYSPVQMVAAAKTTVSA